MIDLTQEREALSRLSRRASPDMLPLLRAIDDLIVAAERRVNDAEARAGREGRYSPAAIEAAIRSVFEDPDRAYDLIHFDETRDSVLAWLKENCDA